MSFNKHNLEYDFPTQEMKNRLNNFWLEFDELCEKYQIDGYIEAGAIPDYNLYTTEDLDPDV